MRRLVIGAALAATLLACYFAPEDEGDMIATASARSYTAAPAPAAPADSAPPPPALDIHPRIQDDELGNVFAKQSWQQEAPKKIMAAPGEAQGQAGVAQAADNGAPALPIRFLGRYVDQGKAAYFLQVGERNVLARVGDTIDDNYTLDSVSAARSPSRICRSAKNKY